MKQYIALYTTWCGVGFMRGVNDYKYHKKQKYLYTTSYLYSTSIIYGSFGTLLYANPPTAIFMMYKEIYRLEVNLRNLENDKKSDFYNRLI